MPDWTGQLLAVAGTLLGTLVTTLALVWRQRKKAPIDESQAAYANAKVLSDASADWVTAVREDMDRMRSDIDELRTANKSLRVDVETQRVENVMLRAENADLRADLDSVYQWAESGATPPPPARRSRS